MRTNPYPEEPLRAQMEDLQPRATPPPSPTNEADQEAESAEIRQEEARTVRYAIGKLDDFSQWLIIVLEVTLTIRFFFKLIGANASNPFACFLYALTDIVLFPFQEIVKTYGNFEGQTIIAMIIYWLIFWAIRRFLHILITDHEEATS